MIIENKDRQVPLSREQLFALGMKQMDTLLDCISSLNHLQQDAEDERGINKIFKWFDRKMLGYIPGDPLWKTNRQVQKIQQTMQLIWNIDDHPAPQIPQTAERSRKVIIRYPVTTMLPVKKD